MSQNSSVPHFRVPNLTLSLYIHYWFLIDFSNLRTVRVSGSNFEISFSCVKEANPFQFSRKSSHQTILGKLWPKGIAHLPQFIWTHRKWNSKFINETKLNHPFEKTDDVLQNALLWERACCGLDESLEISSSDNKFLKKLKSKNRDGNYFWIFPAKDSEVTLQRSRIRTFDRAEILRFYFFCMKKGGRRGNTVITSSNLI